MCMYVLVCVCVRACVLLKVGDRLQYAYVFLVCAFLFRAHVWCISRFFLSLKMEGVMCECMLYVGNGYTLRGYIDILNVLLIWTSFIGQFGYGVKRVDGRYRYFSSCEHLLEYMKILCNIQVIIYRLCGFIFVCLFEYIC